MATHKFRPQAVKNGLGGDNDGAISSTPPEAENSPSSDGVAVDLPDNAKREPGEHSELRRHCHFDCFSGAAGDMLLAACLDAAVTEAAASTGTSPDGERTLSPTSTRVVPLEEKQRLLDGFVQHVTTCLAKGIPDLADEFEIEARWVWRGGIGSIAGLHVSVRSTKYGDIAAPVPRPGGDHTHNHDHEHSHSHEHEHIHGHSHEHEHFHGHSHSHDDSHHQNHSTLSTATTATSTKETDTDAANMSTDSFNDHQRKKPLLRNLNEIESMLLNAPDQHIAPWVRRTAIQTFTVLAQAEATTHATNSIQDVHFHEVGAVDSIVDTVGTLIVLHDILHCTTSFSSSRIPIGEGTVWTAHGLLPVPAPATLRLLVGIPTCIGPSKCTYPTGELVTPTGAALLRTLLSISKQKELLVGPPPDFTLRTVGVGAGTKDFVKHPNILRVMVGDDAMMEGFSKTASYT